MATLPIDPWHLAVRPTQDGTGIAKDVWLLGIGLGLVTEALARRNRD